VSSTIRPVSVVRPFPLDDPRLDRLVDIWTRAYTSMNAFAPDARQRFSAGLHGYDDEPGVSLWAAERGGALVGAMRLFDFTMRIRSAEGLVGGVGMVGVDLLHKKEGVARDLIVAYLEHYRARRDDGDPPSLPARLLPPHGLRLRDEDESVSPCPGDLPRARRA